MTDVIERDFDSSEQTWCKWCGANLPPRVPGQRGRPQLYCTRKCYHAMQRDRKKEAQS